MRRGLVELLPAAVRWPDDGASSPADTRRPVVACSPTVVRWPGGGASFPADARSPIAACSPAAVWWPNGGVARWPGWPLGGSVARWATRGRRGGGAQPPSAGGPKDGAAGARPWHPPLWVWWEPRCGALPCGCGRRPATAPSPG
jgi:hypothetical protein